MNDIAVIAFIMLSNAFGIWCGWTIRGCHDKRKGSLCDEHRRLNIYVTVSEEHTGTICRVCQLEDEVERLNYDLNEHVATMQECLKLAKGDKIVHSTLREELLKALERVWRSRFRMEPALEEVSRCDECQTCRMTARRAIEGEV